jgi:hypothetical protein
MGLSAPDLALPRFAGFTSSMDQRAPSIPRRHPDVGIGDAAAELVARPGDVLRADVKADHEASSSFVSLKKSA